VLDTGMRFDHADFRTVAAGGNLLPGYDFLSDDRNSADGQPGRDADASDPGDAVTQADVDNHVPGCTPDQIGTSSWHGTETAGLIGASTDNAVGIASVGRNVRVLPVRVLGKCGGYDSDIVAGMLWAAGIAVPDVPANPNAARVINMSLGGAGACDSSNSSAQVYIDAVAQINAIGGVVVASAGNSAGHSVSIPADCAGVIGVAGLRHIGTKVGFSDLGSEITISAPGGNCINTTQGSALSLLDPDDDQLRHRRTGRRRGRRLDLLRQLRQGCGRHQLLGAARRWHRRADAVGPAAAVERRGALQAAEHRAPVSAAHRRRKRRRAAGLHGADRHLARSTAVRLQGRPVRCRHAGRSGRGAGCRRRAGAHHRQSGGAGGR
jgi:hypothetical protein